MSSECEYCIGIGEIYAGGSTCIPATPANQQLCTQLDSGYICSLSDCPCYGLVSVRGIAGSPYCFDFGWVIGLAFGSFVAFVAALLYWRRRRRMRQQYRSLLDSSGAMAAIPISTGPLPAGYSAFPNGSGYGSYAGASSDSSVGGGILPSLHPYAVVAIPVAQPRTMTTAYSPLQQDPPTPTAPSSSLEGSNVIDQDQAHSHRQAIDTRSGNR